MNDSVKIYLNKKNTEEKSAEEKTMKTPGISEEVKLLQEEIDKKVESMPKEFGGRAKEKGLEPTRYGDWELKGRCVDF